MRVPSPNLPVPRSEINNAYTIGVAAGRADRHAPPAPGWPASGPAVNPGHIR